MVDYSRISSYIGKKNYRDCITHDDGVRHSDGGGKSSLLLGKPGKGKTTLMAFQAQQCNWIEGPKAPFVHDLIDEENHPDLSRYKVHRETVVWRLRDFDVASNLITENWRNSAKKMLNNYGKPKPFHLWIHKDDVDRLTFYCINDKREEAPIPNLPQPEIYKNCEYLIDHLYPGAINAVVEPQRYRLSPMLINKLREKNLDISEEDEQDQEFSKIKKNKKTPGRLPKRSSLLSHYEKREVPSAYFWFDVIDQCRTRNKTQHMTIFIDEVDDVMEPRPSGIHWALIEAAANTWKDLRKSNISTVISSHDVEFIDWRLIHRIDYFIWLRGAGTHRCSMINVRDLIANLPIGTFLIEQRNTDFGKMTFEKIPHSQPALRIDGVKGQPLMLDMETTSRIQKAYEDMWGEAQPELIQETIRQWT